MNTNLGRRRCLQAAAAFAASPWAQAASADYSVTRSAIGALPDLALVTGAGAKTSLARELAADEPLWLNFVFTTCSTTCSMQTAVLASLQSRLQRESRRSRFLSLTIDPDNDTPAQLSQFAARFGIREDWQFCTGRFDDLLRVQQAFDVYRGSKAAHPPVVMLRPGRNAPWWRVSGFPTADDLRRVLQERQPAG